MRYDGPVPVWQSQPKRSGLLIPIVAFGLLCALGLWWLVAREKSSQRGLHGGSKGTPLIVAEANGGASAAAPDTATAGSESGDADRVAVETTQTSEAPSGKAGRSLPIAVQQSLSLQPVAPAGMLTAVEAGSDALDNGSLDPGSLPTVALEIVPAEVAEGLEQLRREVRALQQGGVSLPVVAPTMRFRVPKAPAHHLSPGRPPSRTEAWVASEGAARD